VTFNKGYTPYTPNFTIAEIGKDINDGVIRPAIAPYWADVDPRGVGQVSLGTNIVDGHRAFGVTWDNVGYYLVHTDLTNRFQLVLIERADTGPGNFDIEFNYDRIQWETGDVSPPGTHGGFGGFPARFGYGNGQGDGLELAGSSVSGALVDTNTATGLIYRSYNNTLPGRFIFPVRCTGSGKSVFVRDDRNETYDPVVVTPPNQGGAAGVSSTLNSAVSGDGLWRGVSLARAVFKSLLAARWMSKSVCVLS